MDRNPGRRSLHSESGIHKDLLHFLKVYLYVTIDLMFFIKVSIDSVKIEAEFFHQKSLFSTFSSESCKPRNLKSAPYFVSSWFSILYYPLFTGFISCINFLVKSFELVANKIHWKTVYFVPPIKILADQVNYG